MEEFESKVGYAFQDRAWLSEALTHSSYGYEKSVPFNERLEFLGDSILGFVVARELFNQFPEADEGTLSKLKSVLVSSRSLARKAQELGLGPFLRLGKGERKAGGHKKSSILADAVEALIGAMAQDGGLQAAEAFILRIFSKDISNASLEMKNAVDFKTLLQERLQEVGLGLPNYVLENEGGPAHDRRFEVRVTVDALSFQGPTAVGTSKKGAQQECAKLLLEDHSFWKRVDELTGN